MTAIEVGGKVDKDHPRLIFGSPVAVHQAERKAWHRHVTHATSRHQWPMQAVSTATTIPYAHAGLPQQRHVPRPVLRASIPTKYPPVASTASLPCHMPSSPVDKIACRFIQPAATRRLEPLRQPIHPPATTYLHAARCKVDADDKLQGKGLAATLPYQGSDS